MVQNLKDAGCDADQIADLCGLCGTGQTEEAVRALRRHRCRLMERLHQSQKRVDCLDYLIHKLEKERKTTKREVSNDGTESQI
ncbi:MAG: hypothetical protein NC399_07940 [Muribaculum sp.]|nr:hypothetical protein [Muribaculum sp.]